MVYIISESQAVFVSGRQISDNILVAHELISALKSKKDCSEKYVAIKTNISKAYDSVEWSFLEATMLQLGFDDKWVALTMECVRSVTYYYLFLLCVEVLIQMLDIAHESQSLRGMRLASRCPTVTYLFFADDSLFFCRATRRILPFWLLV